MVNPQTAQFLAWAKAAAQNLRNIPEDVDLSDGENLPSAFQGVVEHLPVVWGALEAVREQIRDKEVENVSADIMSTMEDCKSKAGHLGALFLRVMPSPPEQRMATYHEAVRELGGDNRVEVLMRTTMEDVRAILMVDKDIENALGEQLRALVEALKKVAAIPPSLQDESGGSSINNYGSGFQNVNTGNGPQHNNNAGGQQFVGGTFHGFNPFQSPRN